MSSTPAPDRFSLLRRLAVAALAIAVVGLPIDHLPAYGLLLLVCVLTFTGRIVSNGRPWLAALALAAVAIIGQAIVAAPRIEEGHNIFLPDAPGGPLATGLPADVYAYMAAQFDAQYPPDRRCLARPDLCPVGHEHARRTYAFSGDGLLDHPAYSRRVDAIDFTDPIWLRLGFVNDNSHNWQRGASALERAHRDRRFWMGLHRWHLTMPWFVMYRLPAAYAGGSLCWRGDVLWEGEGGRFAPIHHADMACAAIGADAVGKRLFGVAIVPETLSMRLDPPWSVRLRHLAGTALMLLGVAGIVGLLVRVRPGATLLPLLLIGGSLLVIVVIDASFIGGWQPYDGGDDGLFYEGVARHIAQYLAAGDFRQALEGGEPVFFYGGPGLRYLRALELFAFGDTSLGYLSAVLALPFVVLGLLRRLLSPRLALAFALIFVFVPLGALYGSSFLHYAGWASRGFADPAAYIAALAGLMVLIPRTLAPSQERFGPAFGAALLIVLGVLIKPVILPCTGVAMAGAWLAAVAHRHWRRAVALVVGFLPVTLMALHNWVYGGVFVPLSSNVGTAGHTPMPPARWLAAARELATFDLTGPDVKAALHQIGGWLAGPSELAVMIPLHAAAIVVLFAVACGRRFGFWVRLIAVAALLQHPTALFYAQTGRYYYLTWFLTFLVTAVWFEQAALPWLQRTYPRACAGVAGHPLSRRLAIVLTALQRRDGVDPHPLGRANG